MPRRTLLDFFADLATIDGEFLAYDDGYRTWRYRYAEVADRARAFAARLEAAGIGKGHAVAIWSENRPEWVIAFWGCLLRGVIVVPIDYRASPVFLARVSRIVAAKLVLIGQDVPPISGAIDAPISLSAATGDNTFRGNLSGTINGSHVNVLALQLVSRF